MYHFAIVEDSAQDSMLLKDCIRRYGSEQGLEFRISEFSDGLDFLETYRPCYDAVFMDIQMPLVDGLSAARRLRDMDESVVLVFVTTLEQYAIKGYEVSALDYIVKPVHYSSMSIKLRRILRTVGKAEADCLVLSFGNESIRAKVFDVRYIEAAEHTKTVHFSNRSPFQVRKSLSAFEAELPSFIRVNNYTLVNPQYVTRTAGLFLWLGEERFEISRARRKAVYDKLTAYMGRH